MITIEPDTGELRGKVVDHGIDAIWLTEGGRRQQIGVIGRFRNAPIQLFRHGMAESIVSEVKRAAAKRDADDVPEHFVGASEANQRAVQTPPPPIEVEEDEDDDDVDA